MEQPVLAARIRTSKGKGAARRLRRNNQVPAIFYGPKAESLMLTVDYPELNLLLQKSLGENILIDLQVQSDSGTETRKVILKDILFDTIKQTCLHADFLEISMDKNITVNIAIRLINPPAGVAEGGILQHIRREISVSCLPADLVDFIEIDVSSLEIGESIHIRDINFPEGITPNDEEHLTIAIIAAPSVQEEELEEEGEGEEGTGEETAATPETEGAEK